MTCSDSFYQTFAANIASEEHYAAKNHPYFNHVDNNYVWDFTIKLDKPLDFRGGDWEVCLSHYSIPGGFFKEFYCKNQNIFLHCNLLENNDKLNKKDSFDMIPISPNYKKGALCFYSPKNPRYIPIKSQCFDSVRFLASDINGEKIKSQYRRIVFVTSTLVRLHFRRRKACECTEEIRKIISEELTLRYPPTDDLYSYSHQLPLYERTSLYDQSPHQLPSPYEVSLPHVETPQHPPPHEHSSQHQPPPYKSPPPYKPPPPYEQPPQEAPPVFGESLTPSSASSTHKTMTALDSVQHESPSTPANSPIRDNMSNKTLPKTSTTSIPSNKTLPKTSTTPVPPTYNTPETIQFPQHESPPTPPNLSYKNNTNITSHQYEVPPSSSNSTDILNSFDS